MEHTNADRPVSFSPVPPPSVSNGACRPIARDPAEERFLRLMDPAHELRRDEIVWILSYVKQKAADEDPALLGLHQPRLLKNFARYAEIALMLIQARRANGQEYGHIRRLLAEACHGLLPPDGGRQP